MKKIIVYGAGGHAMCLIDIILRENKYSICGVIGMENELNDSILGYKISKGDQYISHFMEQGIDSAVIGIGGFKNNDKRKQVYNKLKEMGLKIVNIIDPSAVVSEFINFGDGVVIFPGVVILAEVTLGNNVIVATSSTIAHETVIGNHVLVSAGVAIGANSTIGDNVLFAIGSKSVSGVNIEKNSLIGAGAVVTKDITESGTYIGIPAKKKSNQSKKYE